MREFKKKEITPEVISTFLDGHDEQKRIVNFEYNNDDDFVKVYYRDENDVKCCVREPYYPFVWAKRSACLKISQKLGRDKYKALSSQFGIHCEALDVTNEKGEVIEDVLDGYTYIFKANHPMSYSEFLKFFRLAGAPVFSKQKDDKKLDFANKEDSGFMTMTPIEQFMAATGKRMFKGYEDYDECLRMIIDLETTGLDTEHDRIEQFGIRFNRPVKYHGEEMVFEKIYSTEGTTEEEKNASELKNIDTFLKILYTFKPDIVTAHNGENFDFNMLIGACKRLGTSMEKMSAKYFDGQPLTKANKETILKLGGEIETYYRTIIPQTIVTDSLHAVRRAQALDSNMLFSNLKYVTKYSKIVKNDRTYVPGDRISEIWNDSTPRYAYNKETGDWYIYDANYEPAIQTPDSSYTMDYFQKLLDEDRNMAAATGGTYQKYTAGATAESLYNDYIHGLEEANETARLKKGKDGDKFTLYTKNELLEGYSLVDGRTIVSRYLLDDLWECDKVEHRYNTSNFLICKMLPVPFQRCCTMGTAGQWKALMLAWSYENNLAVPALGENRRFTGGLSRLLKVGFVDNVAKFDYNSLYPSIIITWGISDKKDLMGAMLAFLEHVLTQREKYKGLKKQAGKKADAIKEKLQAGEFASSAEEKKLREEFQYWKQEESANDKKQLPLKILGNSFFGSYGCPSVFPHASVECAERTTCSGRQALRLMIKSFSDLGYTPIVGDSFTPDTPIFIKYNNSGHINIMPISELINESKIERDALGREYDYSEKNYKVLCRSGWVEPSYIYRHKTEKDIYEVSEGKMKINVTEDHSLFDCNKEKIKPSEVTEVTKLEYYEGEIVSDNNIDCRGEERLTKSYANDLAKGKIDRVPIKYLNADKETKELFYNTFIKNQENNTKYSKTCLAGLQYIHG